MSDNSNEEGTKKKKTASQIIEKEMKIREMETKAENEEENAEYYEKQKKTQIFKIVLRILNQTVRTAQQQIKRAKLLRKKNSQNKQLNLICYYHQRLSAMIALLAIYFRFLLTCLLIQR